MTSRSRETLVTFSKPFTLRGWDDTLPPGTYRVVIDEEEVGDLSRLVYRRTATMLHVPAVSSVSATHSLIEVDADELDRATAADAG